jgi:restriction system protein
MPVPDFQSIMLPLLRYAADGAEHTNRETVEQLARELGLPEDERKEMLPSGRQRVLDSRVAWARAHLKMANLIENPRRGVFHITARGREVLEQRPAEINLRFLRQFPEYAERREERKRRYQEKKSAGSDETIGPVESKTPKEQLEEAYSQLRESLAHELLEQLKSSRPTFFEQVVVDVLVRMGYGGSLQDAGKAIGRSNDEGIDGIVKEDRLGLEIIYLQAKRWDNTVSRPEIQKFSGALQGKRARKGVFITTSNFSQSALEYADSIENKIVLIDGYQLAEYMIDLGVGVSTEAAYEVKKLDLDYFTDE